MTPLMLRALKVKVTTRDCEGEWGGEPGRAVACILLFLGENCDRRRFQCSMPTYEYSCEKCGDTFEVVQSMRDESLRECPKELCRQKKWGHGKVKRMIGTGAGLISKVRIYLTDYRRDSTRKPRRKDPPPMWLREKNNGSKEAKTRPRRRASQGAEGKPKKQAAEEAHLPECRGENERNAFNATMPERGGTGALAKIAPKETPKETRPPPPHVDPQRGKAGCSSKSARWCWASSRPNYPMILPPEGASPPEWGVPPQINLGHRTRMKQESRRDNN